MAKTDGLPWFGSHYARTLHLPDDERYPTGDRAWTLCKRLVRTDTGGLAGIRRGYAHCKACLTAAEKIDAACELAGYADKTRQA